MKTLISDRRFLMLSLLLMAIAWYFWSSSRYPALDNKAMMAGALNMEDGLSFDAWLIHSEDESWLEKVVVTFLNWLHTNRQGMSFGLLFAVIAMSIVPLIKQHIFFKPNGWNASLMGFIFGAPLGVCVNCAAPIAYGMYKNGARAELAVATMISSPTFNIIVISMLVSLFAWPLVAIKLGITLGVIFILVPLLVRLFEDEAYSSTTNSAGELTMAPPIVDIDPSIPWFKWVPTALWKNSIYLITKVVPIMLLAGLMGTLVVTMAPWEMLSGFYGITGYVLILATMFVLAFFGLMVPVPMAFDVILSATLISAGVPMKYVAVLLFTLGTFSVYSFMILWKAGARRIAVSLYLCLMICGVVAGLASDFAYDKYKAWEVSSLYQQLNSDAVVRHEIAQLKLTAQPPTPAAPMQYQLSASNANIQQLALFNDNNPAGISTFNMQQKANDGFLLHERPLVELITESLALTSGLAAGDVNNDNWIDVLVGSSSGLYLYLNTGGQFEPVALPFQDTVSGVIGVNGLQDFNNDGTLDLYFSVVNEGGYISYNTNGEFGEPIRLFEHSPVINGAVAFGDIDQNGELDIVEGYHSALAYIHKSAERSRNRLFMQHNGEFQSSLMADDPGETLALLLSDLNDDGWLDLLVGNDFDERDVYYWGAEDGLLTPWSSDAVVTTETSMSIDSADIDNDLQLESYHAQATRNPASPPAIVPERPIDEIHAEQCLSVSELDVEQTRRCNNLFVRQTASWNRGATGCRRLPESQKYDCLAGRWFMEGRFGTQANDSSFLQRWYPDYANLYEHAASHKSGKVESDGLKQKLNANMLYQYTNNDTAVTENGESLNIDIAGWTWNARIADLDGDQWQDIFAANGFRGFVTDTSNVWFKNTNGEQFVQATDAVGLTDYEPTNSSLYLDIDNDADLDLISFSPAGKLKTYLNTASNNAHIQFELNDLIGNRRGIGSKIIIRYADGLQQLREVKASGGYFSQDSSVVHFGLGKHKTVDAIEVRWSTGERTVYDGPFDAQNRYRISRPSSS